MTNKTNKNTKLTLAALLQKKAAKETQEVKSKEVYVQSLEAEIVLQSVKRNILYKISDTNGDSTAEKMYANSLAVYHGVPLFQHPDFIGDGDPVDAVNEVLEPWEISELAVEIMELSGFAKPDLTEDVKN
ncbi:hypothetical protein J40TS1_34050 [Paenibacillus montaniterrae]|uniref:Uncharacterized protein n=1 Tax=Paenibacillus montaniterrae TaxID=429341 RepID=A0A919YVV6_9BACL|nr:hypothetical protein [Paenibacillus montaniterrae]GIP17763.1 hypothetical protein J40TS1_34050 [Paenibacillus montaniterrae]